METTDWRLVKKRTADSDGAVYVSADGTRYRRTGGPALRSEAAFQQMAATMGYPVPQVLEHGETSVGTVFVDEESLGGQSLHEKALESLDGGRDLSDQVVDQLAEVSSRLLAAQAAHPVDGGPDALRRWVEQAGWTDNVFTENPDLDTRRARAALARATDELADTHMVWGAPRLRPAERHAHRGHRLAAPRRGSSGIRRRPGPGGHPLQGRGQGLHSNPAAA
ncbi:hypothetical protein [Streptomyces rubiginosohelvolus]|uniref:hypothetical protein n=1 Tax=Streptomyces rubiginosohelvolus TaxID=67362 RepID=UPI0037A51AE7